MPESFAKKVQRNKIKSPFRIDFDLFEWIQDYQNCHSDSEEDRCLLCAGITYHEKLKEFWKSYESLALDVVCPKKLKKAIVGNLNRGKFFLREKLKESFELSIKNGVFVSEEINSLQLSIFTGDHNYDDMLAAMIDAALLPIRKSFNKKNGQGENLSLKQIKGLAILGQYHYVLLSSWEDCSWMSYKISPEGEYFIVRPHDEAEAKNCAESLSRYYARVSEIIMRAPEIWKEIDPDSKLRIWSKQYDVVIRGYGRKINIFSRRSNPDFKNPPQSFILRLCGSEVYLQDLMDLPLPKYPELSINKILDLWGVIYSLAKGIDENFPIDIEVENVNDLEKFAFLIPKVKIINLLKECSDLSFKQCKEAVDFFSLTKDQPEELWARPFIEIEQGVIAPVLACIIDSNPLRMIERWMKVGGLDLKDRGAKFESYCRITITEGLADNPLLMKAGVLGHAYQFKEANNPGDIDIVIWMEGAILIGEIKCNLFPSRGSEKKRHFEELQLASKQITKKAQHFYRQTKQFYSQNIKENYEGEIKVIPFILINLSLGVGLSYEGVPVVDLLILDKYFRSGYIDMYRLSDSKGNFTKGYRLHFYESEIEATDRIKIYLEDPPQLWHFKDSVAELNNQLPSLGGNDTAWKLSDYYVKIDGNKARSQQLEIPVARRCKYKIQFL